MNIDSSLYKNIVENCADGILVLDEKLRISYLNHGMAEMLSYSVSEMKGEDFSTFTPQEDFEALLEILPELKKNIPQYHDNRLVKKDGSIIFVTFACSPMFEGKKYMGCMGVISDISERKRDELILEAQSNVFEVLVKNEGPEKALKELLKPLMLLFTGSISGISTVDDEGRSWSAVGAPHQEDYLNHFNGMKASEDFAKDTLIAADIETDPRWKDYRDFALKNNIKACWSVPVRNHQGKLIAFFGVYFRHPRKPTTFELGILESMKSAVAVCVEYLRLDEKTKIHHAEMQLISNARLVLAKNIEYEQVLKEIPALMIRYGCADLSFITLLGDDGVYRTNSQASAPQFSNSITAFQKLKFDLKSNEGVSRALKNNVAFYETLNPSKLEEFLRVGVPNPEYVKKLIELGIKAYMAVPLQTPRGKVIGALALLTTKEGYFDNEKLRTMKEIGRSCALAIDNTLLYRESQLSVQARDEFISIASHELRTPLTSLKLRVDLLARMLERGDFPKDMVDKLMPLVTQIEPDIRKFGKLIETLLDISRITGKRLLIHPESCDLSDIVLNQITMIKPEFLSQRTPLNIDIEPGLFGKCDEIRVHQVISNLLSNSLKFGNRKPVSFSAKRDNGDLVLTIKDQGIGIEKRELDRIFKPFERAVSDRHFGGMGLGLFITKEIVLAHGGTIKVESEPGEGTTFTVRLPILTDSFQSLQTSGPH